MELNFDIDFNRYPRQKKFNYTQKGYDYWLLEPIENNSCVYARLETVENMLDLLPKEIWSNPDAKFLDPCCKSGIFLDRIFWRLDKGLKDVIPDKIDRRDHIFTEQLYGLALDWMLTIQTRIVLYGRMYANHPTSCTRKFKTKEGNIKLFEVTVNGNSYGYTDILRAGPAVVDGMVKEAFGDVKFDVVIGNPPYQEKTQSIYQKFIDLALRNSKQHVVMIVKNNWMVSDTLKDTRDNMIKNGLVKVIDYPVYGEIFKNVGVAVNIFHVDKKSNSDLHFRCVRNGDTVEEYVADIRGLPIIFSSKIESNIVRKVASDLRHGSFSSEVYPAEPFRIASNFNVGRGVGTYKLKTNNEETDYYNIKVAYMDGRDLKYKYTNISCIPNRVEIVDEYKIICGEKISKNSSVVSNINIIDRMSACTSSWGVLYSNNSAITVRNVSTYIKTKFFRSLVRIMCGQGLIGVSPYRFSIVPMQDFSKPWTDEELYKKYNLTEEEINYIESTVKNVE